VVGVLLGLVPRRLAVLRGEPDHTMRLEITSLEAHIGPYGIFWRIRGYCTIVCASTRAFQWALVRPLGIKTR
jgi:hypothetical protein